MFKFSHQMTHGCRDFAEIFTELPIRLCPQEVRLIISFLKKGSLKVCRTLRSKLRAFYRHGESSALAKGGCQPLLPQNEVRLKLGFWNPPRTRYRISYFDPFLTLLSGGGGVSEPDFCYMLLCFFWGPIVLPQLHNSMVVRGGAELLRRQWEVACHSMLVLKAACGVHCQLSPQPPSSLTKAEHMNPCFSQKPCQRRAPRLSFCDHLV